MPKITGDQSVLDSFFFLSSFKLLSAKLLMLSGIGPEEELKRHQIPVIHKLEGVTKNLQEHVEIITVNSKCGRVTPYWFSQNNQRDWALY